MLLAAHPEELTAQELTDLPGAWAAALTTAAWSSPALSRWRAHRWGPGGPWKVIQS